MRNLKCLEFAGLVFALLVLIGCDRQRADSKTDKGQGGARTVSSFDSTEGQATVPAHAIKLEQAGLEQVLSLYAEISGRSIIRAGNLPEPKFSYSNQTSLSAVEVLQALDTLLAAQGITTVSLGTKHVKVVLAKDAHLEPAPILDSDPDQLPDSSSLVIYIVKLRNVSPSQAVAALGPFAKLPNSLVAVGTGGASKPQSSPALPTVFGGKDRPVLILRDYSSNVRRMLQVLEKLEQTQ